MNPEELLDLARKGPIRIRMADGRSYEVPNIECIVVSKRAAAVLHDSIIIHLPLVTMTAVEPIATTDAG
jgi:hypothetical protein